MTFKNKLGKWLGILRIRKYEKCKETTSQEHNIIEYVCNGSKYAMVFPHVRGPRKWKAVYDEKNHDVTDHIIKLSGMCHNFHGIPTTPAMLGYTMLTFVLRNNDEYSVYSNEIIDVNRLSTTSILVGSVGVTPPTTHSARSTGVTPPTRTFL
jgi:hypothetical protein